MSKKLRQLVVGVILRISLASSAYAKPKYLPDGERTTTAAGEQAWCFDLEESKELLEMDTNHFACAAENQALISSNSMKAPKLLHQHNSPHFLQAKVAWLHKQKPDLLVGFGIGN